jgi:hypothetical protein
MDSDTSEAITQKGLVPPSTRHQSLGAAISIDVRACARCALGWDGTVRLQHFVAYVTYHQRDLKLADIGTARLDFNSSTQHILSDNS